MEEILEMLLLEQKIRKLKSLQIYTRSHELKPIAKMTNSELRNAISDLEEKIREEQIILENLGARDEF